MYPSVAVAFNQENDKLESPVTWPYLDVKGLVTCAVGYLVDDGSGHAPANMLALPWKHIDGQTASNADVEVAWQAVKARQDLAPHGGASQAFAELTDIRLDNAGMQQATDAWVRAAEPHLRKSFPSYDTMPADGQLGILLMAYALGSAFGPYAAEAAKRYPHFSTAINAVVPDYQTAANESAISVIGNPGVKPRDADIKIMFENAARAQSAGSVPYNLLWWPNTYPPTGSSSGGGNIARSSGTLLGKMLIGGVIGLFGWAGFLGYTNRDKILPAIEHGNASLRKALTR
jgi:hypothetical protein